MLTLVHGTLNKAKSKLFFCHLNFCRAHGFTLLELLVVLVIVAILFSFATLSIRSNSPEDSIKKEALRLDRLIQLALEEAVLKNIEYGLEFKQDSYQFLTYNDEKWQAVSHDKLLRKRDLPDEMEIELLIEQTDIIIGSTAEEDSEDGNKEKEAKPQIFLLSSEEITPEFSAIFSLHGIETSYIVSGHVDGRHEAKLSDF